MPWRRVCGRYSEKIREAPHNSARAICPQSIADDIVRCCLRIRKRRRTQAGSCLLLFREIVKKAEKEPQICNVQVCGFFCAVLFL